jgi:peptidoglycan/xylan/chitin deacetylase (PgdA/CDA1 family)
MKKRSLFLTALLVLGFAGYIAGVTSVQAAPTNLIVNPSVETANAAGTAPTSWLTDKWGTNTTTFSYKAEGYQSNHSVYVTVSGYTSGDAKWYFAPVAVQPNTDYTFSDYYKSNVKTSLVAMSTDTAGKVTYADLTDTAGSTTPASATDWKQYTGKFHTSATAKTLTILHLVKSNGWLQLDAASLTGPAVATPTPTATTTPIPTPTATPKPSVTPTPTPTTTPTPTPTTTPTPAPTPSPTPAPGISIPNASLETAASTALPKNWQHSTWGTSTKAWSYANDGHSGSRSVKVTVSNYKDGDAKWVYDPQTLATGKYYRFGVWYKSNTVPHAVVEYEKTDGTYDYFGMQDPEPAANAATTWQYYTDTFYVPAGTKTVNAFMFLSGNGWVQTDDYSLAPYTYTGFNRPVVSLTFDDAFEENVTTALPFINSYGFKTTQCYATQYVEGIPAAEADVMAYKNSGHETCAHTVTHPMLTQIPISQVDYELQHSRDFLANLTGQPVTTFVSPFGDYNAAVNVEIAKYFNTHRTTDEGFNSKDNFNPYRVRVQNMTPTTTLAQYQLWLDQAKATNTWLVLIYHRIGPNDGTLEDFDTSDTEFTKQLKALHDSGLTVERYDAALQEVEAQL